MGLFGRGKPVEAKQPPAPEAPKRRVWGVSFSFQKDEYARYRDTKNIGVIATNIHEAIAAVEREFPGCTIWDVSHRGEVGIET